MDEKYAYADLIPRVRGHDDFQRALDAHDGHYRQLLKEDDRIIEKFLEDREGDVETTVKWLCRMMEWREETETDSALQWRFDVENIKAYYPHRFCGYTKEGHPIYVERLGMLAIKEVLQITDVDEFTRYHILHWEFVHRVLFHRASKRKGARVDKLVTIVDLSGMNRSLFNRSVAEVLKRFAEIDQHYYPESSQKLIIVNVPWLFKAGWKILNPLLNARGRDKIEIVRGDPSEYLESIVDAEQLPTFLGGAIDWEESEEDKLWVDLLAGRYDVEMHLTVKDYFPRGTLTEVEELSVSTA